MFCIVREVFVSAIYKGYLQKPQWEIGNRMTEIQGMGVGIQGSRVPMRRIRAKKSGVRDIGFRMKEKEESR